ncbi:MAG: hypothetical protein CR997_03015 [Acidobacteria bacterium]|nr:MAG: hypothetical protein CR997_03015 [Acidobacteriota bacterium]
MFERILSIAMENTQADRGVLILDTGHSMKIQALKTTNPDDNQTMQNLSVEKSEDLLVSIVKQVVEDKSPVIIENALADPAYQNDGYVKKNKPKGIVCMPILHQCRLHGVLYLESHKRAELFSEERIRILDILLVQAAISIANIKHFQALEREKNYLSNLINHSPSLILGVNMKGVITFVNSTVEAISGFSKAELIGQNCWKLFHEQQNDPTIETLCRKINKGRVCNYKLTLNCKNGDKRVTVWNASTRKDERGELVEIVGFGNDMTDAFHREEKLKRSEEHKREHLETLVAEKTWESIVERKNTERANLAKSDFLANMSHEIRTPLNAITGFSELLSSTVTDEKQRSYLEAIKSSGKNLMLLIGDILDLSKIEAGKMSIHTTVVNLKKVIQEIRQIFTLQIRKKGISFILNISDKVPAALELDEVRLRQVLLNIVGNAVKFTEKGFIKLTVDIENQPNKSLKKIHITVEDTGIGIAKEELSTIFETFKQQTGQDRFKYGGKGLGLAISKRLVELMGGRIVVESTLGQGSVFKITFSNVVVNEDAERKQPSGNNSLRVQFKKGKVLIVDDVTSNRLFLRELLKKVNLTVAEAQNGYESTLIAPDYQPDLILMDIRMPVMDGYKAAKLLKMHEKCAHIPIIAVTASSYYEKQRLKLENEFDGYVSKPIDIQQLHSELMKVFEPIQQEITDEMLNLSLHSMGDLNQEVREGIPEVLGILNDGLIGRWKRYKNQQPIKEVREFAKQILNLGRDFQLKIMVSYGKALRHAADHFEVQKLRELLDKFPELITMLESAAGEEYETNQ